jgi:hypothetical protein
MPPKRVSPGVLRPRARCSCEALPVSMSTQLTPRDCVGRRVCGCVSRIDELRCDLGLPQGHGTRGCFVVLVWLFVGMRAVVGYADLWHVGKSLLCVVCGAAAMGACGSSGNLTAEEIEAKKRAKQLDSSMELDEKTDRNIKKLLLLGAGESGACVRVCVCVCVCV